MVTLDMGPVSRSIFTTQSFMRHVVRSYELLPLHDCSLLCNRQ